MDSSEAGTNFIVSPRCELFLIAAFNWSEYFVNEKWILIEPASHMKMMSATFVGSTPT